MWLILPRALHSRTKSLLWREQKSSACLPWSFFYWNVFHPYPEGSFFCLKKIVCVGGETPNSSNLRMIFCVFYIVLLLSLIWKLNDLLLDWANKHLHVVNMSSLVWTIATVEENNYTKKIAVWFTDVHTHAYTLHTHTCLKGSDREEGQSVQV